MKQSEVAIIVQRDSVPKISSFLNIIVQLSYGDERQANSSGSLAYRLEKKVLSKVFTRNVVKHFANDTTTCFFDNLYVVLEDYYGKTLAEKILKALIKLVVKLAVTERSEHFTNEKRVQLNQVRIQLKNLCLTVTSFVNVSFSYNQDYLSSLFSNLSASVRSLVQATLSEKSVRRVDFVFEHLAKAEFADAMFKNGANDKFRRMVCDLDSLLAQQSI